MVSPAIWGHGKVPTELPLRTMSRSMPMQQHGSVTHITAREHGKSLVREVAEKHMDVQGLCRTVPTPH